ncbi:hypothetical protein DW177_10890, partial [Blautia sp. AM16-16B]
RSDRSGLLLYLLPPGQMHCRLLLLLLLLLSVLLLLWLLHPVLFLLLWMHCHPLLCFHILSSWTWS